MGSSSTWARRASTQHVSGWLGGCRLTQGPGTARRLREEDIPHSRRSHSYFRLALKFPRKLSKVLIAIPPAPPPRGKGGRSGRGFKSLFFFFFFNCRKHRRLTRIEKKGTESPSSTKQLPTIDSGPSAQHRPSLHRSLAATDISAFLLKDRLLLKTEPQNNYSPKIQHESLTIVNDQGIIQVSPNIS